MHWHYGQDWVNVTVQVHKRDLHHTFNQSDSSATNHSVHDGFQDLRGAEQVLLGIEVFLPCSSCWYITHTGWPMVPRDPTVMSKDQTMPISWRKTKLVVITPCTRPTLSWLQHVRINFLKIQQVISGWWSCFEKIIWSQRRKNCELAQGQVDAFKKCSDQLPASWDD